MAIDMVIIEAAIFLAASGGMRGLAGAGNSPAPAHLPVFRDWDLEALDESEALAYLGRPTLTAEDVFDEYE
jgi:hypothetical protein